jgi:hypothetical protein
MFVGAYAKGNVPLWERFVTTNMSLLACFATLSRLGVTAPGWATAGTCHRNESEDPSVMVYGLGWKCRIIGAW